MTELLLKLKDYSKFDEDSIYEFLKNTGLGSKNNDEMNEENLDDEELDNLESELIDSLEFMGNSLKNIAPSLRKKAKELASGLILKFVQGTFAGTHPLPTYTSRPIKKANTIFDIDLERTIEDMIENTGGENKLWTYQRLSTSNPVVLLLDTSYSMSGLKLIMAGLTVGILAQLVPVKDLCVIGFHKYVYFIKRFDEEIHPYNLINRIMNIVPRGGTNLAGAIEKGGELIFPNYHSSKLLMLTDADVNLGTNPIISASKIPKLDILLFPDGNSWLAKRLVYETKQGQLHSLNKLADVSNALKSIFSN